VIREDEAGNDETISIDKLTATSGSDMSPNRCRIRRCSGTTSIRNLSTDSSRVSY